MVLGELQHQQQERCAELQQGGKKKTEEEEVITFFFYFVVNFVNVPQGVLVHCLHVVSTNKNIKSRFCFLKNLTEHLTCNRTEM